ncbi:MAG TPA: tryptophan 2,3-dioxygenase family protein, partial [Micromonospora sp.]
GGRRRPVRKAADPAMTVHPDIHPDIVNRPAMTVPRRGGGDGTYGGFLNLDALSAATRDAPDHPDGRFFVMVHQAFEIWFELIIHELVAARGHLLADALPDALYHLRRVVDVDRLLVTQLDTLESISPASFVSLRPHLGTASGMQSARFREIEYISGLRERDFTNYAALSGAERSRLLRRLREPSLWDAFCAMLGKRGLTDLARLYDSGRPDSEPLEVAEALMDHDEAWAMWRIRHAVVIERIIGRKSGTGGSTGVSYLNSRRDERFFPKLWAVRTRL